MPWRSVRVRDQRIEFVSRALVGVETISSLCRAYGISRSTGHKWIRRYRTRGRFRDLQEWTRRPHRSPRRTRSSWESLVCGYRRRWGWGARKLETVLRNQHGIELSARTIHRILDRNGLIDRRQRVTPSFGRFEKARPNELWQMDFKGEYFLSEGTCYPLTILDDHSRYALGLLGLGEQSYRAVSGCLKEVFQRHGVPEAILMDHGTPWWSSSNGPGLTRLVVGLIEQGIRVTYSGFGHPQTQGKVERFHRTLSEALVHAGRPQRWQDFQRELADFRQCYNQVRPHEALQMQVPASRYRDSEKAYQDPPPSWRYAAGLSVMRIGASGNLRFGKRDYFVSMSLAGRRVGVESVDGKLLVRFRQMYVREIDLKTGHSQSLMGQIPGGPLRSRRPTRSARSGAGNEGKV